MTVSSSNRGFRQRVAARSLLSRLFALCLVLLAISAQERVTRATPRVVASVIRSIAERPPTVESRALRAESAWRVARAPFLARLPLFATSVGASPSPSARTAFLGIEPLRRPLVVNHFHAKRRIPRMNSEEPPRA